MTNKTNATQQKNKQVMENLPTIPLVARLILFPPIISWIYAISVWFFYAHSLEFPWISKIPDLLIPASTLLVASVASSFTITKDDTIESNDAIVVMTICCFWILAGKIILSIRTREVVGVSSVPFYGKTCLKGKIIAITGANSGIGKETAFQLANMGASKVILLCRSRLRAEKAMEDIVSRGLEREKFHFCSCDLGDFRSIRNAVDQIENDFKSIDILINNAGLVMGKRQLSTDGYELMMQANHLGHFLLTQLLLEREILKPKETSRVINLTSSIHRLANDGFDFDDMFCNQKRRYTMFGQYGMTKLANILYSKELAKRYPKMLVYAVHPGIVRTNVTRNMNWYLRIPNKVFAWYPASFQKTTSEGAYSSVFSAAASKDMLPENGSLIYNCKKSSASNSAESSTDAKRLWQVSESIVDSFMDN